ncbi:Echinoidin [Holothuria leucospilota]|uniref:Echinoidin n=1 Tax=Holothuria leucospilota TaxID=206669 RepID=A0A9Q0YJR5_HOLLE|nr:Echinoidin [Holothuria leucospilota]
MTDFNKISLILLFASLSQVTASCQCPSSWIPWGQHCYRFELGNHASWSDAESKCVAWGSFGRQSHLASIHSKQEQAFIYEVFRLGMLQEPRGDWTPLLWIGLRVATTHEDLSWTDGSDVDFLNWYQGEPNNIGNTGAEVSHGIGKDGRWADAPNPHRQSPFVCKMPE